MEKFRRCFEDVKKNLNESSYDSLLWIVNIVPKFAGFSLHNDKCKVPFFIIQFSLLFYVYGVGNIVYQMKYAVEAEDYIKSYVNVALLIQLTNITHWFWKQRPLLRAVLRETKENDELAKCSKTILTKHHKLMSAFKKILLIFYGVNYLNALTSYLPGRITLNNEFAMQPCVGMEPLTETPRREICSFLLVFQELTIMTCALNYQALILFLISHTAAMYHLLADEIMLLNHVDKTEVREKLCSFIRRHILILDIIDKLKSLYSTPLGVNFASNAVCIAFYFYLPLQELVRFLPIMMYCFLVFFLYCFLCQKLLNAAEGFERAVYSCGWENFNVSEQNMVYLMVILSQKKVEILAADIIPVNIYTFAVTLQSMFKFVTVVKF